tara:strand:+ start:11462 stop:11833 length:372 start_codon:yes stop_codon:yes gene_type:complete
MIKRLNHASAEHQRKLNRALKSGRNEVYAELAQGRAALWQLVTSKANLLFITRREGSELVFVAIAGSGLFYAVNALLRFSKRTGAHTIRFHTRHPEKLEALSKLPFKFAGRSGSESIYRMKLL